MKYWINSGTSLIFAMLVIAACGKSRDEKASPPEPKALAMAEFKSQSFSDLSWESKCSGTKQFFSDFQEKYLPDASLSFSENTCRREYDFGDSYLNIIEPVFERGGNVLKLSVYLSTRFHPDTFSLRGDNTEIDRRNDENGRSSFRFGPEDAVFGENLIHLNNTFEQWLKTDADKPVKAFGLSYADHLALVGKRLGAESTGLSLTFPNITFKLAPGPKGYLEGNAVFTAADLSNYTYVDDSGETKPRKLLNCSDLDCLNSSPITYKVQGPIVTLSSPDVVTGEHNGIPIHEHQTFTVSLDFLKAP